MRIQGGIRLFVICASVAGCGGPGKPADTPPDSDAAAPAASTALIPADALGRCAGVTLEKAAAIVGASPAEMSDYSRAEGRLRMCSYGKPGDRTKAVAFSLRRVDSIEDASASMERERETMGLAQGQIDRVTGSQSKGPAVEDVSAIGDEAFYSPLNGAIMLRVRNVIAQVTAPQDMPLKARAAREVAQGLRQ